MHISNKPLFTNVPAPKIICMYCDTVIKEGDEVAKGKRKEISQGICPDCIKIKNLLAISK